jgi:hypothetical protein
MAREVSVELRGEERSRFEQFAVLRTPRIRDDALAYVLPHLPAASIVSHVRHERLARFRAQRHVLVSESTQRRVLAERSPVRIDLHNPAVFASIQRWLHAVAEPLELEGQLRRMIVLAAGPFADELRILIGQSGAARGDELRRLILDVLFATQECPPGRGRAGTVAERAAGSCQQSTGRPGETGRRAVEIYGAVCVDTHMTIRLENEIESPSPIATNVQNAEAEIAHCGVTEFASRISCQVGEFLGCKVDLATRDGDLAELAVFRNRQRNVHRLFITLNPGPARDVFVIDDQEVLVARAVNRQQSGVVGGESHAELLRHILLGPDQISPLRDDVVSKALRKHEIVQHLVTRESGGV